MHDLISAFSGPISGFPVPFCRRSSWSSASLFASGEQGALYLPGPTTCFQDAAGTTPAGDGDPVGYLADLSGNGNHATQSTSAARPTLAQDAGGGWYLDFDGVDDWLDTGVSAIAGRADRFACVAGEFTTHATTWYDHVLHSGSSSSLKAWGMVIRVQEVDGLGNHYWMDNFNSGLSVASRDVFSINLASEVETYRSARTDTSVDHALPAGASTGGVTDFRLMSRISAPAEFAQGDVFGVVILDRAVTVTERTRLETYLANLSGVTL
ncbi:hypothetical protein [Aquicoccus sp. SU-CL01552]|uniref:hypothetical protein n=1 Tax=Aquicoccus sp. SU-CL01552 TaxID=3127656 RepID=UPI003109A6D5